MGFFHQLLVLLWKNWTIKRGHVWVTVFELATPLVLFVILVGLRKKEPITIRGGTNFYPRPLPSSGMVAVLQEFCPYNDGRDKYGYPLYKNTKIEQFLDHIHGVWENASVVTNGTDFVDVLNRFNESWTNMTIVSHSFGDFFNNHSINTPVHVFDVLKNVSEVQEYLVHNLSMSSEDASAVLNSTINLHSIFKSLHSFAVSSPFKSHRMKRSISSSDYFGLPPIQPPILNHKDRIPFTVMKALPYSLPEEDEELVSSLPILNAAMYGYPDIFSSGLTGLQRQQQEDKLTALETLLLNPDGMNFLLCSSNSDILSNKNSNASRSSLERTNAKLCSEKNDTIFRSLSREVLAQLNNSAILDILSTNSNAKTLAASRKYQEKWNSLVKNLSELEKLSKYIDLLFEIARFIPADSCQEFEESELQDINSTASYKEDVSTTPAYSNESTTTEAPTTPEPPKIEDKVKRKDRKPDYLELWASIQPILCGPDMRHVERSAKVANSSHLHLTDSQKRNLGVLIHVLKSNPKILYAPNNTQVDDVIRKANTSFAIIDSITKAGDRWRNISKSIRIALDDPRVDDTLNMLSQLKKMYKEDPVLVRNLTGSEPELLHFLAGNGSAPNKTALNAKLDTIDSAACGWKKVVAGVSINWFKGFRTEGDAVRYATQDAYNDNASVFATLIFEVDKEGNIPPHITYKIRQNASFTQDPTAIRLSYWRPDPFAWDFRYYMFGFVWVQDLIERSLVWEYVGQDIVSPGAYLHEMPYPCFRFDAFAMNLEHIMPLAMILSWVYTVAMFVQHIVYEKEQRLKEVMKIMGLSNGVHWFAWFVSIFAQLEVTVTVISILVKFGSTAILPNSDFFIIWLFFTTYAAATIAFCFLVSVLFSKAKVASACSGIIYFLTYLPFAYMSIQEYILHQSIPAVVKSAASLLSTTAFGLGAKYFALYELSGYGIQWDNISQTPMEGDTFSLLQAMLMLIVDVFVYAFLTWYIEAVFPGQYGLPRPWYFPFTVSYWMGHGETETQSFSPRRLWLYLTQPGYRSLTEEDQALAMDNQQAADVEPEPTHLNLGIRIENLTKVYKSGGKKAVNKLSLNFYEDQITSFLGHNGAGKTTTMSILTGLFPPTSGTAYIYGCDIRNDMLNIRKSLGMCPQHNALFDVLTVEEHLWFYARLKGVSSMEISKEMDQFLTDVGLVHKRYAKVNTLSGGMKRKLSVAIAFVGGSRTVILDEPTAGVDPYARRAIWDLIIKYKEGRTILLSTHHMDEADLLGDRIAIISNGKLQCCGSSLFLKSTYGDGYNLTLLKKLSDQDAGDAPTDHAPSSSSSSGEEKVTKFVHKHVPSAHITCNSSNQISFNLPFEAARKGCFHKLFEDLPKNMDDLKVSGYGLNDTTLEEVFLKVDTKCRWDSEESNSIDKIKKFPPTPIKHASSKAEDHQQNNETSRSEPDVMELAPSCSYLVNTNENPSAGDLPAEDQPLNARSLPTPSYGPSRPVVDEDIALEWLNSPTSTSHAQQDVPTVSGMENTDDDDEALLLNYAFGDSSFCVPASSAKDVTVNPTNDSITNIDPHNDTDDEALIDVSDDCEGTGSYKLTPFIHNLRILQGLLMKRLHYARRSRKAVFYQIMLPALFVSIAMTVALSLPSPTDPPPIVLSPSQYHNMTQPKGNFIPYSDQSAIYPLPPRNSKLKSSDADVKKLISTFSLPSGVGATCVLKSDSTFNFDLNMTIHSAASGDMELLMQYFNPECQASFTQGIPLDRFVPPVDTKIETDTNSTVASNREAPCACSKDGNTYVCRTVYGQFPVTREVVTGDQLIEVTGKEPIIPYLKYTTNDYRLHRYGALAFGEIRSSVKENFPGWPSPLRKIAVRDAAQVFFNHKGFHAMPTYLNVFNNALLRANLPKSKGNPAAYGITAINHPMNKTAGALSLDFMLSGTDVIIAIFIIVAMSFVPASFLVFLVAEKQSRAKHLQFISGTGPITYWLSNYIWDMLNYLFPAALCIMILQIFDLPAYTRGQNAYAVVALFLLYGWSITPIMYPASFYFDVPSTAYVCLIVLNLFVGITTVVTTFMISLFHDNKLLNRINEKLEVAFLIFPNYNLGKGLMELSYYEYMNDYYRKIGDYNSIRHPFEWNIVTRQLVAMGIEGVAGFLITLLFEVKFFLRIGKLRKRDGITGLNDSPEDVDVAKERRRVEQLRGRDQADDLIIVDDIVKVYKKGQGRTLAVDGISFSVGRGECFGLLGVNGAGKTTTFHAITGAKEVTSGNVEVSGHQMTAGRSHERLLSQQSTGYCPQFDALFNELTPVEHLYLYSRLRGIPRKDEKRVVEWAIRKLNLVHHKNKPVKDLSGGNKRKLSVAIALVGYPPVVLLDEPTSGMDPVARRFLWDLILDVTRSGRAVLLTSHSMEECEVLCSRIAIMVNGKFECLGPTQHLKNRFGDGYMISIRSTTPSLFVEAFAQQFPQAVLKEHHYHKAVFQLSFSQDSDSSFSLAQVFKMLEDKRASLKIEDYSVSQTTLDDVFINFAKNQRNLTVDANSLTARFKRKLKTAKAKVSSWVRHPASSRNNYRIDGQPVSRRDLYLRGSPDFPSPSANSESLEDDLTEDERPLYEFDQAMSLSFLDSA